MKQRQLYESKHGAVECRCFKIWDSLSFLICSSIVVLKWRQVSPKLHLAKVNLYTRKDFKLLGIGSLYEKLGLYTCHITRLQLVYVMGTKQHNYCFFHQVYGKEYHLINWYSLTSFKFLCSILLVLLMIPLAVCVKVYLIYFLFHRELEVVFVWIVWKNQFFFSRSLGFWNCDLRTDLFNGFS